MISKKIYLICLIVAMMLSSCGNLSKSKIDADKVEEACLVGCGCF